MDNTVTLVLDMPTPELLTFRLVAGDGTTLDQQECAYVRPVDNLLLTTVDNLINRSKLNRFALTAVELGTGIDQSSSFYRIAQSFAAAIVATR